MHNPSTSVADALTGPGACGSGTPLAGEAGRCGPGPRLPLLVISAWAKSIVVDHTVTDQSSILRFIEDNWGCRAFRAASTPSSGLNNLFDFAAKRGNGNALGNARTPLRSCSTR